MDKYQIEWCDNEGSVPQTWTRAPDFYDTYEEAKAEVKAIKKVFPEYYCGIVAFTDEGREVVVELL